MITTPATPCAFVVISRGGEGGSSNVAPYGDQMTSPPTNLNNDTP